MLATIRGTDIAGRPVTETLDLPDLTPENRAAAERADAILRKIQRGAYRTARRQGKAFRRYLRTVAGSASGATGEQTFVRVSEIVITTSGQSGAAPISFGYA